MEVSSNSGKSRLKEIKRVQARLKVIERVQSDTEVLQMLERSEDNEFESIASVDDMEPGWT